MTLYSRLALSVGPFVLAAAMVLGGCASAQTDDSKEGLSREGKGELLVRAAEGANNEGDIVGALQLLNDAEKYVPKSPSLHYTRALSFFFRKDYETSIIHLKRALEYDPKFSQANNMLGKIYLDQGKNDLAEKYLKLAADDLLFRESYKAWTSLGMLYYRQGKDDLAIKALDHAISMDSSAACVAHYFRGHLRMKAAEYANAIREYSSATQRQCGGFAEAHMAVATAYERSRQYDLARKKYLEISQLFPNSDSASHAMAALSKLP